MQFYGIDLVEGSEITNLTVAAGSNFPDLPNDGELFYKTGNDEGLHLYHDSSWVRLVTDVDIQNGTTLPQNTIPGTYSIINVDSRGIVTSGSKPTTLAGYGIVDAQPLDSDLTSIANVSGQTGLLKKNENGTWSLDTTQYQTENGDLSFSGDVTGSGKSSITLTLANTGVSNGTFGSAANVAQVTTDLKGRVTQITNIPISIPASAIDSGTLADARISQSSVTQHQTALSISETQITDGVIFPRLAANETVTGNWSFNAPVTVAQPVSDNHAATKLYVDNAITGLDFKQSVRVATTANITLSGTQTIDGIAVAVGDRVLVKNQSAAYQNGIYTVAASAWARATDANENAEVTSGLYLFVEQGAENGSTGWVLSTANPITVGATNLTFTQFTGLGQMTAGAGVYATGSTINVGTASTSRIVVNADNIDLATSGVEAGTYRSVSVDAYGRVTTGTNPSTLAGYGISDAQPLNSGLTAISGLASNGLIVKTDTGAAASRSITVSGVGLSVTNEDGVSGNPTITSNATNANTAYTIVSRDASGNFSAGTITAALSGNAATATKLATARTITIGSTGKSVDGSANVSWSLAEIGAIDDAPSDGTTYGRKDGEWVAAGGGGGGGGGITWSVSGSASTLAADTAQIVTAAVNKTLPASVAAGQQFIVHAKVNGVKIMSNGNVITGVGSGNDLTLSAGETAHLVASSSDNLEIV
jgi:phage-related tail fiber protein